MGNLRSNADSSDCEDSSSEGSSDEEAAPQQSGSAGTSKDLILHESDVLATIDEQVDAVHPHIQQDAMSGYVDPGYDNAGYENPGSFPHGDHDEGYEDPGSFAFGDPGLSSDILREESSDLEDQQPAAGTPLPDDEELHHDAHQPQEHQGKSPVLGPAPCTQYPE